MAADLTLTALPQPAAGKPATAPAADAAKAGLVMGDDGTLKLTGAWTVLQLGDIEAQAASVLPPAGGPVKLDASGLAALDGTGAWVLHGVLQRLQAGADALPPAGLDSRQQALLARVGAAGAAAADATANGTANGAAPAPVPAPGRVHALGRRAAALASQVLAMLALLGQVSMAFAQTVPKPARWRWRQVLFNIRTAGVDALPIVGLLAFLLGVVVAYQSADQLRQYGANIFIVDVVGLSMLREFAPMMTAIIIAGRSGSAYAAQIGTMAVTEEIDAMRTLGIAPLELLVLPKLLALVIALPLLTFFADVMGVLGGMMMARLQLDVSFDDFIARFPKAVGSTAYLVGLGKAPVFAVIIVITGCFQGLQTRGGADSVGRHTTQAVVQATFLVIVADALFSIVFSALDL